jgi:hypothetical protein
VAAAVAVTVIVDGKRNRREWEKTDRQEIMN